MNRNVRFHRYHSYEIRGWLGFLGTILAFIGFFLPYARIGIGWFSFESPSLFSALSYGWRIIIALLIVASLVGTCLACWNRKHAVGCLAALPYSVFILFDSISTPALFWQGHYGFWFTLLGVIMMLLSPVVVSLLCKTAASEVWNWAEE